MSEEVTNLIEAIEAALGDVEQSEGKRRIWDAMALLSDLRAVVERSATETREAQAKAWDEGRESIGADFLRPARGDGMREATPNPYRPVVSDIAEDTPKPCGALADNAFGMEAKCIYPIGHEGNHDWWNFDPARYGVTPTSDLEPEDKK